MVMDHDAFVKPVAPRLPVMLLPLRVYIRDAASTDVAMMVNAEQTAAVVVMIDSFFMTSVFTPPPIHKDEIGR